LIGCSEIGDARRAGGPSGAEVQGSTSPYYSLDEQVEVVAAPVPGHVEGLVRLGAVKVG